MTSVVHIAGMSVQIGLLLRQRCAWCSHTLTNHDLGRDQNRPKIWLPGSLVDVDGDSVVQVVEHSGERSARGIEVFPRELPPNACCLNNTSPADDAAAHALITTVLLADNHPAGAELVAQLGLHQVTTLIVSSPLDLRGVVLDPAFELVDHADRMPPRNKDLIVQLLSLTGWQHRSTAEHEGQDDEHRE